MQFGGHIELNENPWQAITHELKEETGYDIDQLQIMQPKDRLKHLGSNQLHPTPISYLTHPFTDEPHYHTDIAFLFVTSQEPRHSIGKDESPQIKLYSHAEVQDLDTYENICEIVDFAFDTCLSKWETVDTALFSRG
jgi:8-oxo-dGTP pyrophosphatase MutT (NUDIX family)